MHSHAIIHIKRSPAIVEILTCPVSDKICSLQEHTKTSVPEHICTGREVRGERRRRRANRPQLLHIGAPKSILRDLILVIASFRISIILGSGR